MINVVVLSVLGVCVGSFLNVLVDRIPKGESWWDGRSRCDYCKKPLKWYDMVPVLSFVFLNGKCRFCHKKLSLYYPIVEITTGVIFSSTIFFLPESIMYQVLSIKYLINLVYFLFLFSSLIVIFFTDLKYGVIPDKIVFPAVLISVLFLAINHYSVFINHLLSALVSCLFFIILFLATKGRGMGLGDVKYAFLMGLILGFPAILVGLYTAFLTGAFISLILVLWGKKRFHGGTIPFGPFLVLGTFISLFFGKILLSAMFNL